jgi:hypothetical protein
MDRMLFRVNNDGFGPGRVWFATGPGYLILDRDDVGYSPVAQFADSSYVGSVTSRPECAVERCSGAFEAKAPPVDGCGEGLDWGCTQAGLLMENPRRWSDEGFVLQSAVVNLCGGLLVEVDGDVTAARDRLNDVPFVDEVVTSQRLPCT